MLTRLVRSLPGDWPGPGPIDLAIQDLPHASASLEKWCLSCHVVTESGRELSLFATFFRYCLGIEGSDGKMRYAHAVSFALSDPEAKRHTSKVSVDRAAPALWLLKLDADLASRDLSLQRALRAVLARGAVPGPTRMFGSEAKVRERALELEFGDDRLWKNAQGNYELELRDEASGVSCRLCFEPRKLPHRFGKDGVLHGIANDLVFSYFIPHCDVKGELTVNGVVEAIHSARGRYDHEFAFNPQAKPALRSVPAPSEERIALRWLSLQLDGGIDLSTCIVSRGGRVLDNWTVVSDAVGRHDAFTGAVLRPLRTFRSTRSFVEYPVSFQLELPEASLCLRIAAPFDDQEVLSVISDPGFWQGRVQVEGSIAGFPVTGKGWVECKGFRFSDIGTFFDSVGKEVRERVAALLPSKPTPLETARWLVRDERSTESGCYARIVEPQQLTRNLITPIREIVDRGRQSWRSYAALACIDVVGGDSRKFLHWLPIPELLHTGSLIIDDVEGDSTVRRGGPTCHARHGRSRAINSGTAAYFLSEPPVFRDQLPLADKLRIYGLYFDALRAGHAGQALDLAGADEQARRAVQSGDIEALEQHVLAVHRLKTAVPAAMLARIGAILGGGSAVQIEGLGEFFEALGLAFQIVEEVRSLRAFESALKPRADGATEGKITLPVVKALSRLSPAGRGCLLDALRSKPEPERVLAIVDALEAVSAMDDCLAHAKDLVTRGWSRLDPLLEESQYKITFHAFSEYVLESNR